MVEYKIIYTKDALKDIPKLKSVHLAEKVKNLIEFIKRTPYGIPSPYEKLLGNLNGAYLRRTNIQHGLVYEISEELKTIKIISTWSHYEHIG